MAHEPPPQQRSEVGDDRDVDLGRVMPGARGPRLSLRSATQIALEVYVDLGCMTKREAGRAPKSSLHSRTASEFAFLGDGFGWALSEEGEQVPKPFRAC